LLRLVDEAVRDAPVRDRLELGLMVEPEVGVLGAGVWITEGIIKEGAEVLGWDVHPYLCRPPADESVVVCCEVDELGPTIVPAVGPEEFVGVGTSQLPSVAKLDSVAVCPPRPLYPPRTAPLAGIEPKASGW
jgi:hypothetical protein